MSFFNEVVFRWVHNFSGRSVVVDGLAIFLAQYLPYLLVIGFLVLIFREQGSRRRFYLFAEGLLAVILARGIITTAIRFFYYHPRPFDFYGFVPLVGESGSSFPSGHAAWFFALAAVVWYANRKWGIWYFALTTLMGIARIYAGVHFPLDIVGGALVGLLSSAAIRQLLQKARANLGQKKAPTGSSE